MTVRYATQHDVSALVPLLAELGYPTTFDCLTARFDKFIGNPGYGLAVYEIEQKIVGLSLGLPPIFLYQM